MVRELRYLKPRSMAIKKKKIKVPKVMSKVINLAPSQHPGFGVYPQPGEGLWPGRRDTSLPSSPLLSFRFLLKEREMSKPAAQTVRR